MLEIVLLMLQVMPNVQVGQYNDDEKYYLLGGQIVFMRDHEYLEANTLQELSRMVGSIAVRDSHIE